MDYGLLTYSILQGKFSIFIIIYKCGGIKTAIYTPFFIQSCYRTPNGYVKCKTTKLKKLGNGFHGGAGLNLKGFTDYDQCPSSFIYFGLTCVNFNDGSKAMTFYDADLICLEKQAVYFPSHQYQHLIL